MISKDALNYEMEIQENTDIDSVRASYAGYIILWVTGSGRSTEDGDGYYRCLLQFNDYTKYIEGSAVNATANQAMIAGACECIKRVTKPSRKLPLGKISANLALAASESRSSTRTSASPPAGTLTTFSGRLVAKL